MKNFLNRKIIATSILIFSISTACFADTIYKIEKGDTLYSISKKYQLTVAELRAANNLSEQDVIKVGQKLIIPDADIGTAAALASDKKNEVSSTTVKTTSYTVAKGDTLYGIARKNGMTVPELLAINNMDSSTVIKAGQKIKIAVANTGAVLTETKTSQNNTKTNNTSNTNGKTPDTRSYGATITADSSIRWPVQNPKITQVKGKISGVQLSAKEKESVVCIHEGTVMYVGTYRGFGQVVFVQSKTGLIYAYTGLGSVKVRKGEYAVSGAELGTAGVDSITGKPQITFMVFQNGQPIDPGKAPRA